MIDDVDYEEMGRNVIKQAFANPESCTLGPVRVTEVLEVLRFFAKKARALKKMVEAAPAATGICEEHVEAHQRAEALFLKLGGKL